MNVIYRNMERLIACSSASDRERIEPMSAWKWRKLYQHLVDFPQSLSVQFPNQRHP